MKLNLKIFILGLIGLSSFEIKAEIVEIPKKCSVEELEYLLTKNSMMDTEYCFDFSQGENIGFNLGDGAYVAGGYDYLSNSIRSISISDRAELKKSICGGDFQPSSLFNSNSDRTNNLDNSQIDLSEYGPNSPRAQVMKIPGVLNELIWAVKNKKYEFEANVENKVITGVPRVTKDQGVILKIDGYADGEYNRLGYYDSQIIFDLCEKDASGSCKLINNKYVINITENNLKQKLIGSQVGVSKVEKEDNSKISADLKQKYNKPVNCNQSPNHVTCKMFERLRAEGINLSTQKYDSIPSVCPGALIAPANRTKQELIPTMLRNYYLAKDRAENLADFLTNNSSIQGLTNGPDAYKVLSWELTPQIEDIKGDGYGVCDLRRGAKVSVDVQLPDTEGALVDPYAEFTAPFASPSGTTQNTIQLSATLDVFKRLGQRPQEERDLIEAIFNAGVDHTYSILLINMSTLREELKKKNEQWANLKPIEIKQKLDRIAFNLLPYACRGADYSVDDQFNDDNFLVSDYSFHVNMTKKIILDMIAGFKSVNKPYSEFAKLYTKSLSEIKSENILSGNLLTSAMVAFTNKYGKKIKKSDIERSGNQSPKVYGANDRTIGVLDFYNSIPGSPSAYIADLRGQSPEQMSSQYDENLRRNLTPTIATPVATAITFDNEDGFQKIGQGKSLLKDFRVFEYLGGGKLRDAGQVKDIGKFDEWYFMFNRLKKNVVACNGATKYLMSFNNTQNRILKLLKNRYLVHLTNSDTLGGYKNTTIMQEGQDLVVSEQLAGWIEETNCEKENSNFIFASHTPLYSPFLKHAGGVTPSSVLNCYSTREGYVELYKMYKEAEANLASNNASDDDNKLLNDKHFSFTDYKSVAAPNADKTEWFLNVSYSGDILKNVKYNGYTHEHTYGATRKNEKSKNGFVCGGWGSGVAFERQPATILPPGFSYHERKLNDPNYANNLKYAVQFKKAYDYFKGRQSNPMFEYISRFRERDDYSDIDNQNGESASQVFFTDALTKYYQLRAYMKDYYIDKSASKDIKDYLLFGETKSPHLYVLNNCKSCNCLDNIEDFNTALENARVLNFYDGFGANNKKSFDVNDINKYNGDICLFSPFVPHTCSYLPGGQAATNGDYGPQVVHKHVACNLTRYLQSRMEALKAAKSPLLKSDDDADAIIQHCRNKKFYFPVKLEQFNQGAKEYEMCKIPQTSEN